MMKIEKDENTGVTRITIVRPDDWHLHVRNGDMLRAVLPYTESAFARAIAMPNLKPPITTVDMAIMYRSEIRAALSEGSYFEALMVLYLTDKTSPEEIVRGKESCVIRGVKLYPAGATTNSDDGVTDIRKVYPVLEEMQRLMVPLLVHGEVTDPSVDIFDREKVFIDKVLIPLRRDLPELRIVFEHATTKDAVDYVMEAGDNTVATITAHHLYINRNDMLVGGMRPHNFCLPVPKREFHREALIAAATSGSWKFLLGTDSAPHPQSAKEAACGCAGCYTAPSAIELYLRVFENEGKLENFEIFSSFNGPDFYGLPRNSATATYESVAEPWQLQEWLPFGNSGRIVLFQFGNGLYWRKVS